MEILDVKYGEIGTKLDRLVVNVTLGEKDSVAGTVVVNNFNKSFSVFLGQHLPVSGGFKSRMQVPDHHGFWIRVDGAFISLFGAAGGQNIPQDEIEIYHQDSKNTIHVQSNGVAWMPEDGETVYMTPDGLKLAVTNIYTQKTGLVASDKNGAVAECKPSEDDNDSVCLNALARVQLLELRSIREIDKFITSSRDRLRLEAAQKGR